MDTDQANASAETVLAPTPKAVVGSLRKATMKTEISHLPTEKQQLLIDITEILRTGPVEMLILFGSHARGDWVNDPETGYVSDWDLLVVVESEAQVADVTQWGELERRVRERIGQTPLTLIVHDIKFVNREIRIGQYFFADIANEGVMLYDSRRFSLAKPKALNAEERLALAERNFTNWYDSASTFWRTSVYLRTQQRLKESAFLLHQATERYYHAALLVFTGYKQRTHDIELLGELSGQQHALMANVLPKAAPDDKHLFDLLKKAYIDSRYSMSYRITAEELTELQKRVLVLADRVRAACLDKIATFCGVEAMSKDLPSPPQFQEPLLSNLPPPPEDPKDFAQWAQNLAELSEQRAQTERQEGRTEGKAEGVREGLRDGEILGVANALLMILRARGVAIPSEVEERIRTCTDPKLLACWIQRAATGSHVEEIIADSDSVAAGS